MSWSQIYIAVSIVALLVISLFLVFLRKKKNEKNITPLAGLAFAFVIASLIFSDDQLIGYSLLGIGIIFGIIDIIMDFKNKKH